MSESLFGRAIVKRLSAVDLPGVASNQHEIGATALHGMLLDGGWQVEQSPMSFDVTVLRLQDDDEADVTSDTVTLYDTRAKNPNRGPEWRMYYPGGGELERVLSASTPGDLLLYGLLDDGRIVLATAEGQSESETALAAAAAVDLAAVTQRLRLFEPAERHHMTQLRLVLEELGLVPAPERSDLEWLEGRGIVSGADLPSPTAMAGLACERVAHDGTRDMDDLLIDRLEMETRFFYALERPEAESRFDACGSVDETLDVAKSVLNRRRSRRGRSLERHLEIVFEELGIEHETQVVTEASSRSDFIIPSAEVYRRSERPNDEVLHLGVKSTLRERWKQVLSEAGRLDVKHLATIDRRVSRATRDAMADADVVLVVPRAIRDAAYTNDHRILTVQGFVERVRSLGA